MNTNGLEMQVRYLAEMLNLLNRKLDKLIEVMEKNGEEGER